MLKILALSLALGFSGAAFAKADCTAHPKSEWMMKESDAKAQLESQGYKGYKIRNQGRWQLLRDLRPRQGRQEGRDLLHDTHDTKTLAAVKSGVE